MSEHQSEALKLLESNHEAALATVEAGRPFVSATGYLYEKDPRGKFGSIYLLLSDLARHTQNLKRDPTLSLLIVEKNEEAPLHERRRATLQGTAKRLEDLKKFEALKTAYLKVFPRAQVFFTLPDFRFYEMKIEEIHWIGGFGKAARFR